MATETAWNQWECPRCQRPLAPQDRQRIEQQALNTEIGVVTVVRPQGWWNLACGHRVEAVVHRTSADTFDFRLVDRPRQHAE